MKYINKFNNLGDYYKYKLNGPYIPGVNMIHDTTNIISSSKINIPTTYPLSDGFTINNALSTLEDNKNTNYNILFLGSSTSASNIVDFKNKNGNNVIGQYSDTAQQMQGYYVYSPLESLTGYLHNNTYRQPLKVFKSISKYTYDNENLVSVILPDTVETIEDDAFCDTSNLAVINLENVKHIGYRAFYQSYSNSSLNYLNLENIEYIPYYAFYGCDGVNNIIIGNKIKYLEEYLFTPHAGVSLTIKSKIFPETYNIETIFDVSIYNNFSIYIPVKYDTESYSDFLDYFCGDLDIPLCHKIQGTYDSYISQEKYLVDYDTPFVRYSGRLTNINGIDELTGEKLINASSQYLPAKKCYLSENTTGSTRTITLTGQVNGVDKTFTVTQGYNPIINISTTNASTTTSGFYTAPDNAWQYEYIDDTTGSPKKYRKFSSNCAKINSGYSTMTINVKGCDTFTIYLRNYSESYYDYIMASKLDTTINQNTIYNDTNVAGHCYSYEYSGDDKSGLTKVTYENLAFTQHTITIVYKKDAADNQYDDAGYVYIPDDGNLTFPSTCVKEPTVATGFFNVYLPIKEYSKYTSKSVELFSAVTATNPTYNNIYVHNPESASSSYVYVNSNIGAESDDSLCIMRLDLYDIEDFTVYIKQRTEYNYDFVVLSGLDCDISSFIQAADNNNLYSTNDITSEVYISFAGVLSDEYGSLGDDDSWTAVDYNVKEYEDSYQSYIHYDPNYPNIRYHWIYVLYRKDASNSSNGDYVHVFIREDPNRIIT